MMITRIAGLLIVLMTTVGCADRVYLSVSGLNGELTVKDQGQPLDQALTVTEDGRYEVLAINALALYPSGNNYNFHVEILSLPTDQVCTIVFNTGVLSFSSIFFDDLLGNPPTKDVQVTCVDNAFADVVIEDDFLSLCINQRAQDRGWTEVDDVTSIECRELDFTTTQGLEQFTQLRHLNFSEIEGLNTLDLSALEQLEEIALSDMNLSNVIMGNKPQLVTLSILGSTVYVGRMDSIDLSGAPQLVTAILNDLGLTELDISANTQLTTLSVRKNKLTSLNLSSAALLKSLDLHNNMLTAIDFSATTLLETVDISNNKITDLWLAPLSQLSQLIVRDNQLVELDLSNNTQLVYLGTSFNNLTSIDISNNTQLVTLLASVNKLTSIDVSNNTLLEELDLRNNGLNNIDLSHNGALAELNVSTNRLSGIDLLNNSRLIELRISSNDHLTEIDLSNNIALERFYARNSSILSFDFSHQSQLRRADLEGSKDATTLILSPTNNLLLDYLDVGKTCFDASVIDSYKKSNGGWIRDVFTDGIGEGCLDI